MATEFFIKASNGSLEVHALTEHPTITGFTFPVRVLDLRTKDESTVRELNIAHTVFGDAVLLEIETSPESIVPTPVDTATAAQAVLEFFSKKPEVMYHIHDENAVHIGDEFLLGMPNDFVRSVQRLRNPNIPTGVYI